MPRGIPEEREFPEFDARARTEFLRRTMARALTPKAQRRAESLLRLEGFLLRQMAGRVTYREGRAFHQTASVFPVSHRAMWRELHGLGPQPLVEVAEQLELRYRCILDARLLPQSKAR